MFLASLRDPNYKPTLEVDPSISNTQFAMLAVWGSRTYGVPVRAPLLVLSAYFHANQFPDGHWIYPANSLTGTSTCAGLISLALERVLLNDKEFRPDGDEPRPQAGQGATKRADVHRAFTFLAQTAVGRKRDDPGGAPDYGGGWFNADAWGDLYFLWTLERVGVIYSTDKIDGKDWFDWGYPIILENQQPDGSWAEANWARGGVIPADARLIDTSFALLFLKRSNIAADLTDKLRLSPLLQLPAVGGRFPHPSP